MSRTTLSLVVGATLFAAQAGAATVTYVSVDGKDAAACTRTDPCRTFAGAIPKTDREGTVVALDSGVFSTGHLDIRQPVTLAAAPGVHAHLLSKDFAAISVNTAAGERVVLRGLTLTAVGDATPLHGIVDNGHARLQVEECIIRGFPTSGILAFSGDVLSVVDTLIQGSSVGVFVDTSAPVVLERLNLEDNQFGVSVSLGGQVTIRDSVVTGSTEKGLSVYGMFANAELTVVDCVITHNKVGVSASAEGKTRSILRLSDNTITNNDVGVFQSTSGVVESRGNNTVRGNGVNIDGVITHVAGD